MPEQFALTITRRCNIECGHCSVESNPRLPHRTDPEALLRQLREAASAGVRAVRITGGEPMLLQPLVMQLLREARRLGMVSSMASNGFWGRTPEKAGELVRQLLDAGLNELALSYDRYHAAHLGPEPLCNIAREAARRGLGVSVVFTRTRDDTDLEQLVAPFRELQGVRFRFYDVQPVGAARKLDSESLPGNLEGFCHACQIPAVTDDGRLIACNGPAYFSPPESPLVVGSFSEHSLTTLLQAHDRDPILESIRTFGPKRLLQELAESSFVPRERYGGMCELCTHICSDPEAVAHLRERLTQPEMEAERVATALVIRQARDRGCLSREYVGSAAAARMLFQRLQGGVDEREDAVLSRGDVNWVRVSEALSGAGLAGPASEALRNCPWVPAFVHSQLEQAALRSSLRQLLLRDALAALSSALQTLGTEAVLLKGAAMLLLEGRRTTGDIDLWLPPASAQKLHHFLQQENGWEPQGVAARHHLIPLVRRGVILEIHTALMPKFWGLPDALTAGTIPTSLPNLRALRPEAFLIHTAVHCTKHGFTQAFKSAWDVRWALHQGLDFPLLESLVRELRLPAAFWTPILTFQHLGLQLDPAFLRQAPSHFRQKWLNRLALTQLLAPVEHAAERNPFLRVPLYGLLHDNIRQVLGTLRILVSESSPAAPRRLTAGEIRLQALEAARTWRSAWRLRSQATR